MKRNGREREHNARVRLAGQERRKVQRDYCKMPKIHGQVGGVTDLMQQLSFVEPRTYGTFSTSCSAAPIESPKEEPQTMDSSDACCRHSGPHEIPNPVRRALPVTSNAVEGWTLCQTSGSISACTNMLSRSARQSARKPHASGAVARAPHFSRFSHYALWL